MTLAQRRADAVLQLIRARESLDRAMDTVPDYTGQYSSEHFYREEQREYDEAVEEYGAAHAPDPAEIRDFLEEHLDILVDMQDTGHEVVTEVSLLFDRGDIATDSDSVTRD